MAAKEIAVKKYIVKLSEAERSHSIGLQGERTIFELRHGAAARIFAT